MLGTVLGAGFYAELNQTLTAKVVDKLDPPEVGCILIGRPSVITSYQAVVQSSKPGN